MVLTPEGESFIQRSKKILDEIDDIERTYKNKQKGRLCFSISAPGSAYIADAFAQFSNNINVGPADIYYKETSATGARNNLLNDDYHLGIIRYESIYDEYMKETLRGKSLTLKKLCEFKYVLLMNKNCPIASKESIRFSDLIGLSAVISEINQVHDPILSMIYKDKVPDEFDRCISCNERGSQYEILQGNENAFGWAPPMNEKKLDQYNLIQRDCTDNKKTYMDVLVWKKDYKLTALDRKFLKELNKSLQKCLSDNFYAI